jgi:hypothetical protein
MKNVKPGIFKKRCRISGLVIGLMILSYTGRSQLPVSDFGIPGGTTQRSAK